MTSSSVYSAPGFAVDADERPSDHLGFGREAQTGLGCPTNPPDSERGSANGSTPAQA
jgi:hypothetical protein